MPRNLRNAAAYLNSQPAGQRPNFLIAPGAQIAAYCTTRQDIASSVVMQDTALSVNLALTGYWFIELYANILISAAANNIRWQFSAPDGLVFNSPGATGVSLGRSYLGISGAASQEDVILNVGTTVNGGTTSAWTSLRATFGGWVGSAGTLMFQFAQGVSGAPATSLLGGSIIRAQYLANNLGV